MNEYKVSTMALRHRPIKCANLGTAHNWAARWPWGRRIVHGDDGMFWVVCPADAMTLEINKYQI